ncbi:flagellar hook-associated protein 2 [Tepidibacillus sp. LV47]|uniref:flagellar hook-associated protein 2 n=1 Tax=Tepidibacillus sp. LV47 TaxID=3398228 RepID=UPI003AAD7CBB
MSLRIGGLASGMDIDSIVEKLMKVERIPLDKLTQKKQILEWQRDAYREMNTLLYDFKTFLSVTQTDGIGRQSTFLKKVISSSNESAVTAKNISGTTDINTQISVTQLAKAASMWSAGDIRSNQNFNPDDLLVNQKDNLVNGADLPTTSFNIHIQAIQADGSVVDKSITVDPSKMSLNQVINEINKSLDVNAFYDTNSGKVVLSAKHTGDAANQPEIKIMDTDTNGYNFMTSVLRLSADSDTAANNSIGQVGQNAKFTFNGMSMERTSNIFQINGYEYTLKNITANSVTLTSTTDTDAIFDSIKKFVDKYNETIDKINSKISEKRYRDYPPLTEAQKKEMKDKEIELWEEKAKSGLLYNDNILSSGLNQMRLQIYDSVDGLTSTFYDSAKKADTTINQLANIGITTSSNYLDKGKLVIDEAKLKEAISQNPMAIYELFNKEVKNADGSLNFKQSGIVTRLEEVIGQTIKNIEVKAGKSYYTNNQYTLGRLLDQVNSDITDFEQRLKQIEDRYWRQFTAMEQAINQSNQQSMYLMQQFGLGQ